MEIHVSSSSTIRGSGVVAPPAIPIVKEAPEVLSQPTLINLQRKKQTTSQVIPLNKDLNLHMTLKLQDLV